MEKVKKKSEYDTNNLACVLWSIRTVLENVENVSFELAGGLGGKDHFTAMYINSTMVLMGQCVETITSEIDELKEG